MRFTEQLPRLFACMASALITIACAQAPTPNTPEPTPDPAVAGEGLMRSMSNTLAQSKSFTFETSEQLEVMAPGGEKSVVHLTRKVTVRRPNGLLFELHGKDDKPLEIDAYYDGRTVTLNEKGNGKWAQTDAPGTLDEMLDDVARRFGLPIPVGDVVYSSPYDAFVSSTSKGGLVGQETIDGVSYAKLDYADDLVQVKLWIPTSGRALPRRLEIVYKKAPTPLTTQVNFTNWNLDAPVSEAAFSFQPPANRGRVEFGVFTRGLTSRLASSVPQAASAADAGAKPAGKATAP